MTEPDSSTVIPILAGDLTFGEGPRWHEGRLWFSDFYVHQVKSIGVEGDVRVEVDFDDRPSGLGWLPDGRLLMVSMTRRQLWRRELDGSLVLHADLGALATFHCNDMVVDAAGTAYVGHFGFDLHTWESEMASGSSSIERTSASIIRVSPDGTCVEAAADLEFPNGTVITPAGELIVAESGGRRLTAFSIASDGTLHDRRTWAELGDCVPDGICLDADGHIWVADAASPRCVLVAEGGTVLRTVETGDNCFACMLGGADRRTLFCLTSAASLPEPARALRSGAVRTVRVEVEGAGRP